MYTQLLKNISIEILCLIAKRISQPFLVVAEHGALLFQNWINLLNPQSPIHLIIWSSHQKRLRAKTLFASKTLKVQRLKVNIGLYLPFISRPTIHPGSFRGSQFYLFEQRLLSFHFEHFVRFIILCHFRHFIGHYDWAEFVAGVQGAPGPGSGSDLLAACQSLTKPPTAWSSIFNDCLLLWQNIFPIDKRGSRNTVKFCQTRYSTRPGVDRVKP